MQKETSDLVCSFCGYNYMSIFIIFKSKKDFREKSPIVINKNNLLSRRLIIPIYCLILHYILQLWVTLVDLFLLLS